MHPKEIVIATFFGRSTLASYYEITFVRLSVRLPVTKFPQDN